MISLLCRRLLLVKVKYTILTRAFSHFVWRVSGPEKGHGAAASSLFRGVKSRGSGLLEDAPKGCVQCNFEPLLKRALTSERLRLEFVDDSIFFARKID